MGFWLHVHPGFASTRAFHSQICKDISPWYATSNLTLLGLPVMFAEPEIFFTSAKCKGSYDGQSLQTNILVMYETRDDFDRSTTMITHLTSFATADDDKTPCYVPFALKRNHPNIYGQYLAQQNAFLESHRNIAIVGAHPDAMDYGDETSPDPAFPASIWQTLSKMDGVYRVDPCRRTADLGKWNISCHTDAHPGITNWIDNYLVDIWKQVPTALSHFTEFPIPERLSRHRSPRSVSSGLTNASPVSHYLQTLATRHQASTKLTTVLRNPWKQTPPVASVQYEFNTTDFLPPPTPTSTLTARTAESAVAGTSAVTAATLQDDFNNKLHDLDAARVTAEANFQSRMNDPCMNDLEDTMSQVCTQLADIAQAVTARENARTTPPRQASHQPPRICG
jgi:hypothetical protein